MNTTGHDENAAHGSSSFFSKVHEYLGEFVYGGIDGSITTFAVVAGATGAGFSANVIVVLGFANMLADGLSMSIGSFLSSRAEKEHFRRHRRIEYEEIEKWPDIEREEIRVIYRAKGFEGQLLEDAVTVITADKDRWVNEMMKHELEMIEEKRSPFHKALATYISFITIGLVPILIYILDIFFSIPAEILFPAACLLTLIAFLFIGYLKARVNSVSIIRGIFETVALGSVAAAVSYFVGDLLSQWVG